MTGEPGAKDASPASTDEDLGPWVHDPRILAWAGEHLPELRRSVSGQRTLRWSLVIGFVVGLVAHVTSFLLKTWETTEPLTLLADLLYTLGWALWTGVVLVVFFQVVPQDKTRQIQRAADAFEAALREQARAGNGQAPDQAGAGEGSQPPPK
jgi:hypothetical protein